jgi:pilus assembly protein CpaE
MSAQAEPATSAPYKSGVDHRTGSLTVAMLTVCVDPEIVQQLAQEAAHRPWAIEHLEFDRYMSALLRPRISAEAKSARAVVAVIDFDQDAEQALITTAYLHRLFFGKIAIVALGRRLDADFLLRAMRAGCNEFLDKPLDPARFEETLARLEEQWSGTMGKPAKAAQILSFFGAKGGVGTTTVALQLAMALVTTHRKKVLLIDNHRDLGHVCLYLGMDGTRYHFDELMRNLGRLDSDLLRGFIATHPGGLDVLSSPDLHDELRRVDPEALRQTLEFLRGDYDYVLVDCETSLAESSLAVMDCSDQIYLVATPEIGAIRDLSRYVDGLVQNAHTTEKLHVVINRYSSEGAVSIEHIEKAIRLPVEIRICNNYFECVRAVNVGEPISPDGASEFSVQFAQWARSLVGGNEAATATPAKKRFAWLR